MRVVKDHAQRVGGAALRAVSLAPHRAAQQHGIQLRDLLEVGAQALLERRHCLGESARRHRAAACRRQPLPQLERERRARRLRRVGLAAQPRALVGGDGGLCVAQRAQHAFAERMQRLAVRAQRVAKARDHRMQRARARVQALAAQRGVRA